jgi:hypothetical protein
MGSGTSNTGRTPLPIRMGSEGLAINSANNGSTMRSEVSVPRLAEESAKKREALAKVAALEADLEAYRARVAELELAPKREEWVFRRGNA